MMRGNVQEWDISLITSIFLFAPGVAFTKNSIENKALSNLRDLVRNPLIHRGPTLMTNKQFEDLWKDASICLVDLGVKLDDIDYWKKSNFYIFGLFSLFSPSFLLLFSSFPLLPLFSLTLNTVSLDGTLFSLPRPQISKMFARGSRDRDVNEMVDQIRTCSAHPVVIVNMYLLFLCILCSYV